MMGPDILMWAVLFGSAPTWWWEWPVLVVC
jgi:hypothetical protein